MKILLVAIGSRGDVQPYVNLCQGLQAAGHDVTLATNPTLISLAEAHNIKSAPVGPPMDMGEAGARLMAQSFNNMWIGLIRVMSLAAKLVEDSYPDVLKLLPEADLLISTDTSGGIAEAGRLGKPWISATLQPARLPLENSSPSALARIIWPVMGRMMVAPTNRFRKRVGAPLVSDITDMLSRRMILLPVSRHVAPPDPRWPAYVRQTGYWFPRPLESWNPPPDLLDFLARGEAPIAVSLGVMSMSGKQAREGAQIVLDAIRQCGARAIIQGWDEALRGVDLPETVYHAGSLPHGWLFEQVRAVVHHGGFGTTASVFRSGAPGIIVPHVIDQFYWGQRAHELGVGPDFIPRGKLTAQNLAQALEQALGDATMRASAAQLAQQIRTEEDGVSAAVRWIETEALREISS